MKNKKCINIFVTADNICIIYLIDKQELISHCIIVTRRAKNIIIALSCASSFPIYIIHVWKRSYLHFIKNLFSFS